MAMAFLHNYHKLEPNTPYPECLWSAAGNIVLGQGSNGILHAKLADFGLAKCKAPDGGGTVMASMIGTLPYTCPEIVQQEPYSSKADIWSLG